jgi:hypothetical protein
MRAVFSGGRGFPHGFAEARRPAQGPAKQRRCLSMRALNPLPVILGAERERADPGIHSHRMPSGDARSSLNQTALKILVQSVAQFARALPSYLQPASLSHVLRSATCVFSHCVIDWVSSLLILLFMHVQYF